MTAPQQAIPANVTLAGKTAGGAEDLTNVFGEKALEFVSGMFDTIIKSPTVQQYFYGMIYKVLHSPIVQQYWNHDGTIEQYRQALLEKYPEIEQITREDRKVEVQVSRCNKA